MRNPRRITLDPEMVSTHKLNTDPPPKGSLFWEMWEECIPIAKSTLETPFIQGIKAGNLDPVKYGGFNVNDAFYCFHAADDYERAAKSAEDTTLKAFLYRKFDSYVEYNTTFPTVWHVNNGGCVVPFDVCRDYSNFEREVATTEHPIYTIVTMLPCDYLWAWLGNQLEPVSSDNLYEFWVKENLSYSGAYGMGNFLDEYEKKHPKVIDHAKAIEFYKKAMNYEFQMFTVATS